jgi:hypothetical protein
MRRTNLSRLLLPSAAISTSQNTVLLAVGAYTIARVNPLFQLDGSSSSSPLLESLEKPLLVLREEPGNNTMALSNAPVNAGGSVESMEPASPTVQAHYKSILLVTTLLGLLFAVEAGLESGIGPCTVTTLSEDLDASITSVAAAQTMAEVTKIAGSVVVAIFTTSAAVQSGLIVGGAVVWSFGAFLTGLSQNVATVGAGFFFLGLGYSFLAVLVAPVLEYYVVTKLHRHKVALYLGVVYAASALGVAAGFVLCGATVELSWRWNYLGPAIVVLPVAATYAYTDRRAAGTRRNLGTSEIDAVAGFDLFSPTTNATATEPMPSVAPSLGSPTAKGSAIVSLEASLARLKPPMMPLWRILLHTKVLLSNRCYMWCVVNQTATMFYLTAYIILLPVFLEHHLEQSKGVVSAIMAATVPASAGGLVFGGFLVQYKKWGLDGQLALVGVTEAMAIPIAAGFFFGIELFACVLTVGMVIIFVNGSPGRTLLPLLVDEASLVPELLDAVHELHASGATSCVGVWRHKPTASRAGPTIDYTAEPMTAMSGEKRESATTAAPSQPEHHHHEVATAREVLVAHSNALLNVFVRLLGSVPGPIVLAALADHSGLSYPAAFCIVGAVAMSLAALGGYMAWKTSPTKTAPIPMRKPVDTDASAANVNPEAGSNAIVYVTPPVDPGTEKPVAPDAATRRHYDPEDKCDLL